MKKLFTLIFLLGMVTSLSLHAQVVINEVYGSGGNSGSTFKNDFIELYNSGSSPVSLVGWSVQYASATGTGWQKTDLTGSIPANGYYLIQEATGNGGTTNLPTPDVIGTIPMSGTAGKVALVNNNTLLTGSCPTGVQIKDFVGYGATASTPPNCFEGAGPAPLTSNNTQSVQRTSPGLDNNNNSTDFAVVTASPTGSGLDVTPPTVNSFSPADNATGVNTTFTAIITFSEAIQKGTGSITLKKVSDNSIVQSFDVTTTSVTVSNSTAYFDVSGLAYSTDYYFEIPAGAFKDLANNSFAGITGATAWNFTTAASVPQAALGTTYSFNNCLSAAGVFPDGFTQFSQAGTITWSCTTLGRDPAGSATANLPYGVQINGFANNTNVANIDWLISPKFDLSSTTYPLLSFWSRTRFNGAPLQLKVSTDYAGTGDPNLATWTDLNGRFPQQASDVWTQSSNINLAAFKSTNVYVAFVYTATDEEGSKWTLDDIRIDNSATPPPSSLTVSTTDVQYTYVPAGSTSNKTFTFTGNDITGNVSLAATGNFLLSKDGTTFSASLTYTQAEANNTTQTVYVQFAPDQANKSFAGTITISTAGLTSTINTKGTSIDPANTLEVVNWNMEWFGSTDPAKGPTNDALQQANAQTILQNIGADLYGLVEVVDEARLAAIVNNMPGYSYVIGNYGSHTNPPDPTGDPVATVQKEAFVYKTSVLSNVRTRVLINNQNINSPSYSYWASGRYPFLMTADVTLNGQTKTINFVLVHAKANTSPISGPTGSYARRQNAANELHDTLMTYFPNDNVFVLGDFNDDLDQSVADGFTITSYSSFTNDNTNFFSPTLALSLAGKKSTVKYNDVIDHVIVSNELRPYYMNSTANILTDVANLVANYGTTTSDHYPVFTRFAFDPGILPVKLVSFNAAKEASSVKLTWTTSQEVNTKEFLVERSFDGLRFEKLTIVPAKGNSNEPVAYQALDLHPAAGNNYYRLRTMDFDGKSELSKVVKINFGRSFTVSLSPNPASQTVVVSLANNRERVNLQLLDAAGKLVRSAVLVNAVNPVSLAGLGKGIYLMKLNGATESYTERLVIE